jgi:Arc/MetJ-type ribon-helix-helix transcriptional regulator
MPRKKLKESPYHTVSIPMPLWEKIERVVETGKQGYQNEVDFVLEAVRRRLRELHVLD